jgi:hypothetical protein
VNKSLRLIQESIKSQSWSCLNCHPDHTHLFGTRSIGHINRKYTIVKIPYTPTTSTSVRALIVTLTKRVTSIAISTTYSGEIARGNLRKRQTGIQKVTNTKTSYDFDTSIGGRCCICCATSLIVQSGTTI